MPNVETERHTNWHQIKSNVRVVEVISDLHQQSVPAPDGFTASCSCVMQIPNGVFAHGAQQSHMHIYSYFFIQYSHIYYHRLREYLNRRRFFAIGMRETERPNRLYHVPP